MSALMNPEWQYRSKRIFPSCYVCSMIGQFSFQIIRISFPLHLRKKRDHSISYGCSDLCSFVFFVPWFLLLFSCFDRRNFLLYPCKKFSDEANRQNSGGLMHQKSPHLSVCSRPGFCSVTMTLRCLSARKTQRREDRCISINSTTSTVLLKIPP